MRLRLLITAALLGFCGLPLAAQQGSTPPTPSRGVRYPRLLIRNAMVIDGTGNPVHGPLDIMVEGSTITSVRPARPVDEFGTGRGGSAAAGPAADKVIDATGMYVMPGIIDVHSHIQFSRSGPMPKDYEYKLLLAHGITTIRDPGSGEGIDTMVAHARLSAENRITAPTIIPYATVAADNPTDVRAMIRRVKAAGAMGLKVFVNRPDVWDAIGDEAKLLGLPIATDMRIQEYDVRDAARLGVRSIEHWYGIPDAAIPGGVQHFPETYNFDNESDRFRWAGDLWRQADSARLSVVLDTMLAHHMTWDPTFGVYEANRDIGRAQTLPWFAEYAHPAVMAYFAPDPTRHGSYHFDWSTADEVRWKNNYRIWMKWVHEYAMRGGNVTVGSDAGFIYHLYGFATIREMELQQEAGFEPLEVIQHATSNGAKLLGIANTGVIRAGYSADIAIVDGNPLQNMKVLYATGVDTPVNGKIVKRGGVRWTIKQGIVFDGEQLRAEIRQMVKDAKAQRAAGGGQ
ncbi:MAG: amidohydrolase [Gemmatimonadetes bacterium]|nr:amidohydrolase [Gemmatimonadota bacterium]